MLYFMINQALIVVLVCIGIANAISEDERVQNWHNRGNTWPPQWNDDSDSYKAVMAAREREIMSLSGGDERWENWMQFVQGMMLPRFTQVGFDVVKTPAKVHAKLKKAVEDAIANWDSIPEERGVTDSIFGPEVPKFVEIGGLAKEVMADLKELHEEWASGIKLFGTSAYGVRLYRRGASMVMHNDKVSFLLFCLYVFILV
jgi:hypothetical protein